MTRLCKRLLPSLVVAALAGFTSFVAFGQQAATASPDLSFPTVLYGAAYYNEYMPGTMRRMRRDWRRTLR